MLATARANPTKNPDDLTRTVQALQALHVDYLLTIGGDDTATSAMKVAEAAGDRLKVAHVPKTIDNDLPLPGPSEIFLRVVPHPHSSGDTPTFGYRTAQAVGHSIVRNLMTDAKSSPPRWYIVVSMVCTTQPVSSVLTRPPSTARIGATSGPPCAWSVPQPAYLCSADSDGAIQAWALAQVRT